ncbi:hypothetical protein EIN_283370 [Entamoeba invadens IP1]|uniref:DNA replication complex GINS protein PSF1 n=1 Tax=Entamoeba invadens IP1 TaxID=370355 RepID=L7FJK6_ENTIV|nr:hypothetical protein EIN_283370 [Entamoeba invadens IP1]ELP84801.1 hypothetical protein EIN_283370 [Entamoeba invadens IP1]|eukprot:XP_004184147.1 hypothetical protein EIN_283370 [Entamoeba invadens IP1]
MSSSTHENLVEAIKELTRCGDALPPANAELIKQVKAELTGFVESSVVNPRMVYALAQRERLHSLFSLYVTERLRRIEKIRWDIGTTIPLSVSVNMTSEEKSYFKKFSSIIGDFSEFIEVDVTTDTNHPPVESTVRVKATITDGMKKLPQAPGIYSMNGFFTLNHDQVQLVERTPTIDALIHIGVLTPDVE